MTGTYRRVTSNMRPFRSSRYLGGRPSTNIVRATMCHAVPARGLQTMLALSPSFLRKFPSGRLTCHSRPYHGRAMKNVSILRAQGRRAGRSLPLVTRNKADRFLQSRNSQGATATANFHRGCDALTALQLDQAVETLHSFTRDFKLI